MREQHPISATAKNVLLVECLTLFVLYPRPPQSSFPRKRESRTPCATEGEVIVTIETGETFPAKFGRTGFRRNFAFGERWKGKFYATKQVEVYAVEQDEDWLAITFVTRFF